MARPEQITYSRGGLDLYDSGEFEYDELGNIIRRSTWIQLAVC